MEKFAIMRLFNYENANIAKAKKVSDYIQSPKRTAPAYVFGHGLDVKDVCKSLETIESRWKPKGSRLFKHGVLSFGQPDLTPEKAVEVTKEILDFFKDYPWLAAVHINCPHRVHSHFLLGCINLLTGRKYSQGVRELQLFKDFYGNVANRHGLPVPKNWHGQVRTEKTVKNPLIVTVSDKPIGNPSPCMGSTIPPQPLQLQPFVSSYVPQNCSQVNVVQEILDWYADDFRWYFMMGAMK